MSTDKKLEAFSNECIEKFKKVKPDWSTPHKTIYATAKKHGFKATIDGMTEATYDKEWEEMFDDGTLEGDRLVVNLIGSGSNTTEVVFASDDLRHLRRVIRKPGKAKRSAELSA